MRKKRSWSSYTWKRWYTRYESQEQLQTATTAASHLEVSKTNMTHVQSTISLVLKPNLINKLLPRGWNPSRSRNYNQERGVGFIISLKRRGYHTQNTAKHTANNNNSNSKQDTQQEQLVNYANYCRWFDMTKDKEWWGKQVNPWYPKLPPPLLLLFHPFTRSNHWLDPPPSFWLIIPLIANI